MDDVSGGLAPVVVLSTQDVAARMGAARAVLLADARVDELCSALEHALAYRLGPRGQEAVEDLGECAFLAGLPSLPCCLSEAHGDQLERFAAAVEEYIAATAG